MTNSSNERLGSLTMTLVRHGESTDNIQPIWAGHRDATLTNFGHAQAERLGKSFKDETFHKIFCSDLQRARLTADQIRIHNLRGPPKVSQTSETVQDTQVLLKHELVVDPLLREQNFGHAEGERWDSGKYSATNFYTDRSIKFESGENRDDVKGRAETFLKQVVLPEWASILNLQSGTDPEDVRFCIVSHGIFLAELIGALKNLIDPTAVSAHPDHFANTGWARFKLTRNFVDHQPEAFVKFKTLASNQTGHLVGLKRQSGAIGSAPWDPKQSKIDSFLGNESTSSA